MHARHPAPPPHTQQENTADIDQLPEGPAKEKALAMRGKVEAASRALDDMLAVEGGACQRLVEAIIVKYIALSPFELQEWENDPEGVWDIA